jgi:hypothetical protein
MDAPLHDHDHPDELTGPEAWATPWDRGGRRMRRGRGPGGRGAGRGPGRGHGWGGRGGPFPRRAARGDVRAAILALLAEQPMHGYQMISELDERTGGAWSPSPGSVYPTLQLLEDEGLVEPTAEGGKKVFHLTDMGQQAAAAGDPAPWDSVAGDAAQIALGQNVRGLMAAFQQVARTGTPDQVDRASTVLNDARKALYGILAEDAPS